jgi:large subunit ribosomal protein L3
MRFILGKKLGMSQIFDEKGNQIPITLIEAGPCFVTQIKTKEKDGYEAIQIGFEKLKEKKVKKTMKGKEFRYLREAKIEGEKFKLGDKIDVSIFKEGDLVSVSGITKGKGFAGAVKRFKVAGFPKTHGTKHGLRSIGSIGAMTPERVIKGKKMPGRMGGERVTVKNLEIVKIDKENNLIAVKGAVPGRKGTLLEIKSEK